MKPRKSDFFKAALCGASLFLACGCNTQDVQDGGAGKPQEEDAQARTVRAYILSLGFSESKIVSTENYFVVEGDILFDKHGDYGQPQALAKTNQYVNYPTVDRKIIRNVRVKADASLPSADIANLDAALNVLNGTHSQVHFQRVTSGQHVLVKFAVGSCQTPGAIACSTFPSAAGVPGTTVSISMADWVNWGSTLRTRSLIHELMHTIGFSHNAEFNPATNTWSQPTGQLAYHTPDWQHEEDFGIMHVSDWSWAGRDIAFPTPCPGSITC